MKLLLPFLLLLTTTALHAQTLAATDTLHWKISGFRNLTTQEDVTNYSEFVSKPDTVVWLQNGGEYINNFLVTAIDGAWPDTSANGSITFAITWGAHTGTIVFRRSEGVAKITIDIPGETGNMTPFDFVVSSITKN